MGKSNRFLSCFSIMMSILIVVFIIGTDYNLRWPFLSFLISIIGGGFLIFQKRIIGVIFLVSAPLSIINGLVSQEIVLSHAENMRKELFQSQGILDARKKYNFICRSNSSNYCNSILFIPRDNIGSSYLIVFKFFGRRQIIPLNPEEMSYESEIID
jgi:hypothetical protein